MIECHATEEERDVRHTRLLSRPLPAMAASKEEWIIIPYPGSEETDAERWANFWAAWEWTFDVLILLTRTIGPKLPGGA